MGSREKFILRRLLMISHLAHRSCDVVVGLIELMPGDPAAVIAGSSATEVEIADIRTEMGPDEPLADRYVD